MKLMPLSKSLLSSKASLTVGLGAGMFAYSSVSASQPSFAAADAVFASSSPAAIAPVSNGLREELASGVAVDGAAPVIDDLHDRAVPAADGIAPDSGPTIKCAPGYYFCWSNVQQKSVCTTRKCYETKPQPKPPS